MPRNTQIEKRVEIEANSGILAFKPRQVLLSLHKTSPHSNMKAEDNNKSTLVLKPEQRTLLLHCVARYLDKSGFSITLKKFRSEADIKNDDVNELSFDLEEIFCKFLDFHSDDDTKSSKSGKVQESQTDGISKGDGEKEGDGKKKKKNDKTAGDKSVASENSKEAITHEKVSEEGKSKKKKKESNLVSEPVVDNTEETKEKSKDKEKKKKKKSKLSSDATVDIEKTTKTDTEHDHRKIEDATEKHDKSSKKRKRVASEEDATQPAGEKSVQGSDQTLTEESKRRKTEGSEEPNFEKKSTKLNSSSGIEETPKKEGNDEFGNKLSNGSLEVNGGKSSMKKAKKQQNDLSEPKSVKHFQRIKVDEVVISDVRLKDNSYWAKDGAEIGYGAKAQEVLGQVRGRDFRHEKTKKKRGSYRGGQIDLQSHSVKFNYSDED